MRSNIINLLGLVVIVLAFVACEKDRPVIPNEEELITTLNYTLTPTNGGAAVVLTFKDLDGDGGNAPTITGGTLSNTTVYTGTLELLNEAEDPIEDITEEIAEEDLEHQFFFAANGIDIDFSYADVDGQGQPIGLSSTLTVGGAGTGTLTVTLRHEPNKLASGVINGQIANAGGETDIEVVFPITIQ